MIWFKNNLLGKILLGAFLLSTLGCPDNPIADSPVKEPERQVFFDDYDEVWRAIQLAVRKYPVRLNNIESGILETDYVKGDSLFSDPMPEHQRQGLRYRIVIRAIKGKEDSQTAIKVTVEKEAEIQPDFFTGYQPAPTYGLEESTIMYRIRRYLEMDKILSKASANQNK